MKIDRSVKEATAWVALGVLFLSVLMQLIYLIVVLIAPTLSWHYSFLLGNLLMGVTVVLNFFLMSLGIQNAVSSGNEEFARKRVRYSQSLRSLMVIAVLVVAFVFRNVFNIVSTIITVAFPQISIYLIRIIRRDRFDGTAEGTTAAAGETLPSDQTAADSTEEIAAEGAAVAPIGNEEVKKQND